MSSPQQPWSPGQSSPSGPPPTQGRGPGEGSAPPQGYGPAQEYGPPPGYGAAQGYGPTQEHGSTQQHGAPQPYGGGLTGELVINLRKPFGAVGMISPALLIDGHPVAASWGRNPFQVPAGVRQVDVAQAYLWTYGRASLPVNVAPGTTSEIFYSGPTVTFGFGGAIGTEPQRRPGSRLFVGLMVSLVVLLLLVVLAVVVGNS